MTENRGPRTRLRVSLVPFALTLALTSALAQTPKPRLELADSVRGVRRDEPFGRAVRDARRAVPEANPPTRGTSGFGSSFVRDQTILGALVYGPSFAATATDDPISWTAAYVVVGGGTYFVASQLARDLTISEPASWFATQTALRGALAAWAVSYASDANRHDRAGGVFLGSVAGAVTGLATGRGMTDGEVAASTFGADVLALTGLALTHMGDASDGRTRAGTMAVAGLAGYPLGYWYASRAPYRVTAGDVTTLWPSAGIGAVAAGATIANGNPSGPVIAATLTAGALAGVVLGDRLLVRPFDHSPWEGQLVALGATAGGVMGAGVAMLSGAAHERVSAATAALTAAGAAGGVLFTERWLAPRGDVAGRVARLELRVEGVLLAATHLPGAHSILRWSF